MKKILTLLLIMFMVGSVYAENRVLYIGETAIAIDSNAELFEFTGGDATKIVVTKKSDGAMVAGTPYLVNMTSAKGDNTTFTGVTVSATTAGNTSAYGGLTFYGNYTVGMDMQNKYGVAYDSSASAWKIKKGASNSTLPAFCGYFTGSPSNAPSRGFSIEVGDGTTGIDAMERVVEEDNGPTYNLMGQQTTTPRKGIYIKNGKKYIAK